MPEPVQWGIAHAASPQSVLALAGTSRQLSQSLASEARAARITVIHAPTVTTAVEFDGVLSSIWEFPYRLRREPLEVLRSLIVPRFPESERSDLFARVLYAVNPLDETDRLEILVELARMIRYLPVIERSILFDEVLAEIARCSAAERRGALMALLDAFWEFMPGPVPTVRFDLLLEMTTQSLSDPDLGFALVKFVRCIPRLSSDARRVSIARVLVVNQQLRAKPRSRVLNLLVGDVCGLAADEQAPTMDIFLYAVRQLPGTLRQTMLVRLRYNLDQGYIAVAAQASVRAAIDAG